MTEVDAGTSRDVCILEVSAPPGHATGVHAHHGDEHHVVLVGPLADDPGRPRASSWGRATTSPGTRPVPHDVENIGDEPGRSSSSTRAAAAGAARRTRSQV